MKASDAGSTRTRRKLPADVFERYYAMGPARSYRVLARELGVNTSTIQRVAGTEKWQERVQALEAEAQREREAELVHERAKIDKSHRRALRLILSKALRALKTKEFNTAEQATRGVEAAIKLHRLIEGESTENVKTIEEIILREQARWLGQGDN